MVGIFPGVKPKNLRLKRLSKKINKAIEEQDVYAILGNGKKFQIEIAIFYEESHPFSWKIEGIVKNTGYLHKINLTKATFEPKIM